MTMLLKRHPDLTHEAFVDHHVNRHGPLFCAIPEAAEHVKRYIQTHPVAVGTDAYDGTAELWFDDMAGLEAVLTSDFCRSRVLPDEKTFLDHSAT
jgi:hypothetical protein